MFYIGKFVIVCFNWQLRMNYWVIMSLFKVSVWGVIFIWLLNFCNFSDVDEIVRLSQGANVSDGDGQDEIESILESDGDSHRSGVGKKMKRQFKEPDDVAVINDFSSKKFTQNSNNKIRWAVNLYSEWRANRLGNFCKEVEIVRCDLGRLNQFCKGDMNFALSRFI